MGGNLPQKNGNEEPHLKVFDDRTTLVDDKGVIKTFKEGPPNEKAKERLSRIRERLDHGWLDNFIKNVIHGEKATDIDIDDYHRELLDNLVSAVTSEVGRAIVGLTVLQLTIKSLEPSQSIRLHKGGRGDFSWSDGLPMRSLDADYVTPALRKYELVRLNIYGFMMTRSLAENYPYSRFYKAAIRGGKKEWAAIVDEIENNSLNPEVGLTYLISLLSNRSEQFRKLSEETVGIMKRVVLLNPSLSAIKVCILSHIIKSTYSSRLLEVAMHSLFQVAIDEKAIPGYLTPLCQMRNANKKHRNIGDIEIVPKPGSSRIIEAWDAKFGKENLRDELDELNDKLEGKPNVEIAGFVTDGKPQMTADIVNKMGEIKEEFGTNVMILSFQEWVTMIVDRINGNHDRIAQSWLIAYVESLCQMRRDRAPIDEPSDEWVKSLRAALKKMGNE